MENEIKKLKLALGQNPDPDPTKPDPPKQDHHPTLKIEVETYLQLVSAL